MTKPQTGNNSMTKKPLFDKEALIEEITAGLQDVDLPIRRLVTDTLKRPYKGLLERLEDERDAAADAGNYLEAYIWARILNTVEDKLEPL